MFSELDQPNKFFAVSLSLLTMPKKIQPPMDKNGIIDLSNSTDDEEQEAPGEAEADKLKAEIRLLNKKLANQKINGATHSTKDVPQQKVLRKGDLKESDELGRAMAISLNDNKHLRNGDLKESDELGRAMAISLNDNKHLRKGDCKESDELGRAMANSLNDNKHGQKPPVEERVDDSFMPPQKKNRASLCPKDDFKNLLQPQSISLVPSPYNPLGKRGPAYKNFNYMTFSNTTALGHPEGTTLLHVSRVVIHNILKAMEEAPDQTVVNCKRINTDGGIKLLASTKDFKVQYAANLLFFGIMGDTIHDCREHLGESTYTFFIKTGVLTPVRKKWFDQMVDLLIETVDPTLTRDKIENNNFHTNCSHWMTQFEKGCWSNARLIEMMENRNNTGQLSHELVSGLYWPFVQLADNLMPAFAALVDKNPVPRELQYITDDEYKNWPDIIKNRVHDEDYPSLEQYNI